MERVPRSWQIQGSVRTLSSDFDQQVPRSVVRCTALRSIAEHRNLITSDRVGDHAFFSATDSLSLSYSSLSSMASASSSHHPDSVANIRIFPDHFAHTISPACDVLDEFIKLLETPRDHDEQAGIAISIHRGDRIDALRLHLTRLKADLERIREGTLSLSISVNNALGITTNRSFAASSFEHQPHANLQRVRISPSLQSSAGPDSV